MTVYVDNEQIQWRGNLWCHMVADTLPELHEFAQKLGLRRSWFQDHGQYWHYDITVSKRNMALSLGAVSGDKRTIVTCAKKLREEKTRRIME
ncbi:MAG: DUF4031 domain-containing protein [Planctomycetia bacterium]|nr:DUF4031 domain-containing protein [Planctomycetia bacterium]